MAFGLKVLMNSKDHFEISFYLLNWQKYKCLTVYSVGKNMFPKLHGLPRLEPTSVSVNRELSLSLWCSSTQP